MSANVALQHEKLDVEREKIAVEQAQLKPGLNEALYMCPPLNPPVAPHS